MRANGDLHAYTKFAPGRSDPMLCYGCLVAAECQSSVPVGRTYIHAYIHPSKPYANSTESLSLTYIQLNAMRTRCGVPDGTALAAGCSEIRVGGGACGAFDTEDGWRRGLPILYPS